MSRLRLLVVFLFPVLLLDARPVLAQPEEEEEEKLADLLYFAFPAQDAPSRAFVGSVSNQLSTFPMGSSAGGFSWTFDTTTGAFVRASQSFGPLFAERALTVGRNKLNIGFNYQRATYDEFEEQSLSDGDLRFAFDLRPFANLLLTSELNLELNVDTAGLFANYGISDRLDVGVAIPLLRVKADVTSRERAFRPNGQEVARDVANRELGFSLEDVTESATASGIGDVVVRGKYKLLDRPGGGLAVALDVRLPTGDEEDLLGIAGTQAKLYGIYSTAVGRVAPHVNIGYTFSNGNDISTNAAGVLRQANGLEELDPFILVSPPHEFNYTGGADIAIHPRITLVGDVVGRVVRDVLQLQRVDFFGLGPQFEEIDVNREKLVNQNLTLGSVGVKINPGSNLLFSVNALFPITKGGLRDKFTPVFGVDWSF